MASNTASRRGSPASTPTPRRPPSTASSSAGRPTPRRASRLHAARPRRAGFVSGDAAAWRTPSGSRAPTTTARARRRRRRQRRHRALRPRRRRPHRRARRPRRRRLRRRRARPAPRRPGRQRAGRLGHERADDARPRRREGVLRQRLRLGGRQRSRWATSTSSCGACRASWAASRSSRCRATWSPTGFPGEEPGWSVDFWVDDMDATVARVPELGGAVLDGPHDLPIGRQARLADPQGATFSVTKIAA